MKHIHTHQRQVTEVEERRSKGGEKAGERKGEGKREEGERERREE